MKCKFIVISVLSFIILLACSDDDCDSLSGKWSRVGDIYVSADVDNEYHNEGVTFKIGESVFWCVLFVRLHPLFAAKAAREFHTKIAITIFAGNNTQEKWQEKRQITRLSNRWRSFRWRLKGRRWDAITT